jgi:hypothetical protein
MNHRQNQVRSSISPVADAEKFDFLNPLHDQLFLAPINDRNRTRCKFGGQQTLPGFHHRFEEIRLAVGPDGDLIPPPGGTHIELLKARCIQATGALAEDDLVGGLSLAAVTGRNVAVIE